MVLLNCNSTFGGDSQVSPNHTTLSGESDCSFHAACRHKLQSGNEFVYHSHKASKSCFNDISRVNRQRNSATVCESIGMYWKRTDSHVNIVVKRYKHCWCVDQWLLPVLTSISLEALVDLLLETVRFLYIYITIKTP